jgi:hypothetical protein
MSALLHGDYLRGWFFEAVAGGTDAHAGRSSDRLPVGTSLFRNSLCDWGPGQQRNLSLNALWHHWATPDSDVWQSPPQARPVSSTDLHEALMSTTFGKRCADSGGVGKRSDQTTLIFALGLLTTVLFQYRKCL